MESDLSFRSAFHGVRFLMRWLAAWSPWTATLPLIFCAVTFIAMHGWCADANLEKEETPKSIDAILTRLKKVEIPQIDFQGAEISKIFEFMSNESKRADP